MLSPAFARVLADGRAELNRRVQEARRRHPGFDQEAFGDFLAGPVDALVAAVAAGDAQAHAVREVAHAAYDTALELAGLRLVGPRARSSAVAELWRDALPRCAHLAAQAPETVPGMLTNAVLHLETLPGTRPRQWIDELAAIAPRIADVGQLRPIGQLLAWRAGAAHFRAGALAAADTLPPALALAALREPGADWPALRARIEADLWWRAQADAGAAPGWLVGAYTGFGGMFATPPEVRSDGHHFLVRSGARHFLLLADAYGHSLLAAEADEFAGAVSAAPSFVVDGGVLRVGGQRIALDLPDAGIAVCATDATLAIASPYTHAIRLVPRS